MNAKKKCGGCESVGKLMDRMGPAYVRENIAKFVDLMAANAEAEHGWNVGLIGKAGLRAIVLGACDVMEGKPWPQSARIALRAARTMRGPSPDAVQWKPVKDRPAKCNRLVITVATGSANYYELTIPRIRDYAKRVKADFVVIDNDTQQWWGLEKFRVYEYARRARQTLFLDADVVMRDSTDDLFEIHEAGRVLIHNEFEHLKNTRFGVADNTWWLPATRQKMLHSQYEDFAHDRGRSLNSGVVLVDKETAGCWKPPKHHFLPEHCSEQVWVDHQVKPGWLQQLDGTYNFQWWRAEFDDNWGSAQIPHLSSMGQFGNRRQWLIDSV